jgi:hypothetical protein
MRQAEVAEAVKVLRSINEGYGATILGLNSQNEGATIQG